MERSVPRQDEAGQDGAAAGRLDRAQEADFERLAGLAARVFGVPIAAVAINCRDLQFYKATVGFDAGSIDFSPFHSCCEQTSDRVFVLLDATKDPVFATATAAGDTPQIGFFACALLYSATGQKLGEFCILDHAPRCEFSEHDRRTLLDFAAMAVDQIERRRLAIDGRASQSRFENIASTSPDGIICTDRSGTITFWNKAAECLFGYKADEAIGQNLRIIVPERFRSPTSEVAQFAGGASGGAPGAEGPGLIGSTISLIARRYDGTEFPIELSLSQWQQDGEASFGAIIRDVTQRLASEEWLFRLAHLDSLTELPNRMVLRSRIDEAIEKEGRASILLIDLDGFKDVNDTLGHSAGDMLLKMVANRILALVGEDDTVARLGGDEFAALLPGLDDPLKIASICDSLITAIAEPFTIEGQPVVIGASIGIALCPVHGQKAEDLLANADLALYQAKAEGRHCRRFFVPALRHAALNRRTYEIELRKALMEKQFELYYQPLVRLSDGGVIGAEALLRWRHPQRGLMAPGAFFSVLESSLLAAAVGDWVLETACAQAAKWRKIMPDFRISINLFGMQFKTGDIESMVRKTLAENGLPPNALELEITENIILRHDEAMTLPLRNLHHLGVGIAFDDYGTGYASLSFLKRFPLSHLKLDRSFVRDSCTDPEDAAIVQAILYLGQSFGLGVIAEGVETPEQQAFLLANGCREAQGFLFGRPMSADAFAQNFLSEQDLEARSA
jgi:diguanylate cyclase (GGDEF)-like protein/PAS domain S-box-containing protein